jgi:uncharacterized membrane protein
MNSKTTGILMAATAAALFSTASIVNAGEASMGSDQVKCSGVNACKGMSDCATASNACKGHNSCKGKGWMQMSRSDCEAKGGTVIEKK